MAELEAQEKAEQETMPSPGGSESDSSPAPTPKVTLVPGAAFQAVQEAGDTVEQIERLQAWEVQLQTYSDQLTEQGWTSWKKMAVTSVMNQLQRTVVPDLWKDEVQRMEQHANALEDRVRMGAEKERALLARIEAIESGPGCAKELREQLEATELRLEQQQARERQQSVFKQLLTSGAVSANAGGGAPALRRRATVAGVPSLSPSRTAPAKEAEEGGDDVTAATDERADGPTASGAGGGSSSLEAEQLRIRLAQAERDLSEAQEEMRTSRAAAEERSAALEAALEAERKQHRLATEQLESLHLEAGIHEVQEMVQLRMELSAASEEADFLRSRQAKLHEEEHRLQMVAEMNKRLGTNVSKFELEALKNQVASLTEEAQRVQKHNVELQKEAKRVATDAGSLAQLHEEITAFQKANDRLESELLKRQRHEESLKEQVRAANARLQLLQRQLAISHRAGHHSQHVHSAATARRAEATAEGGGGGGSDGMRRLPLLWDAEAMGSPSGTKGTGPVHPAERPPQHPTAHVGRAPVTVSDAPSRAAASGGAVTQRAVELHDDVASEPIAIERVPPAAPHIAQSFPRDACRTVRLKDNSRELAAAQAWKEAEEAHGVQLHAALKRQHDGDSQELRVVKASLNTRMLYARTAKLGTLKHYRMLGMMRALCKWALLLEMESSYHAALGQAAHLFVEQASCLADMVADTQQRTVQTLLIEPQMLGELGEVRRKLQRAYAEADELRGGLRKLCDANAKTARVADEWYPDVQSTVALRERLALPPPPPGVHAKHLLEREATVLQVKQEREATLARDAMRLQLRVVLRQWRTAKRTVARQGV